MPTPQDKPRLSVLLPCYNHAEFVAQALEALVTQSHPADEILVADDASTDGSVAIIDRFAASHPNIRVLRHAKNQGCVATIGHLLSAATGEYVYCGAADDYVLPGFFELAMQAAEHHPQAGILCGQMIGVDRAGHVQRHYGPTLAQESVYLSPEDYLRELVEKQPAFLSLSGATIYRRAALDEIDGFRAPLGAWADSFAARAIALRHGACYLSRPCTAWRRLPNSFSRRTVGRLREKLAIVRRAAALMRSESYRDRFPEPHVRRWVRRYRAVIVQCWLRDLVVGSLPRM